MSYSVLIKVGGVNSTSFIHLYKSKVCQNFKSCDNLFCIYKRFDVLSMYIGTPNLLIFQREKGLNIDWFIFFPQVSRPACAFAELIG